MEYRGYGPHITIITELHGDISLDGHLELVRIRTIPSELSLLVIQSAIKSVKDPKISFSTRNDLSLEAQRLTFVFPGRKEKEILELMKFDVVVLRVYMSYSEQFLSFASPIHREILDLYSGGAEEMVNLMILRAWGDFGNALIKKIDNEETINYAISKRI